MYSKSILKLISFIVFSLLVAQQSFALTITSQPENATVSATVGGTIIGPIDDNCSGCSSGSLMGIVFSGYAYPKATVHVWKNGTPKVSTIADLNGYFTATLTELYNPNVLYTLYAIDKANRRSILLNYPVVAKTGFLTVISGIRFPPTIALDKTEVKAGDYLTVLGYAIPNAAIDVVIDAARGGTYSLTSNKDGTYQLSIPLLDLRKGKYNIHVNYHNDKKISKVMQFTIGDINILSEDLVANIPGDCNADQIINIVDFSVAAFWYSKPNPPKCVDTNNDNIINLVDFSILAFYWTG